MKKFFSLILSMSMILGMVTVTYAKTGDILGYAKYTDISAYINHYPITSYNINDYTAIVAEDLRNYGFNVVWDGENRSLSITKNSDATQITPYGTVYKYSAKAGQNSFPYLQTDIVTYVNGSAVESFNIDGKTCVYMDALSSYGDVIWVPEIRAIKMWISDLPQTTYQPLADISTTNKPTISVPYTNDTNKSSISATELKDLMEWINTGLKYENNSIRCCSSYTKYGDSSFKRLFDESNNGAIRCYENAYNIAQNYTETDELAYYINQMLHIHRSMNSTGVTRLDTNGYIGKFQTITDYAKKILDMLENLI